MIDTASLSRAARVSRSRRVSLNLILENCVYCRATRQQYVANQTGNSMTRLSFKSVWLSDTQNEKQFKNQYLNSKVSSARKSINSFLDFFLFPKCKTFFLLLHQNKLKEAKDKICSWILKLLQVCAQKVVVKIHLYLYILEVWNFLCISFVDSKQETQI